jgi:hypothetical protein
MSGESSRFTSDRRSREGASWVGSTDWDQGTPENVDIVDGGLVPQPQSGAPEGMVEDFEDSSLARYRGDVGSFNINSDTHINGAAGLEGGFSGSRQIVYSLPGDGLDHYPERGEVISCYVRDDHANSETSNPGFLYGVSGSEGSLDGYAIWAGPFFSDFRMYRFDGGSLTSLIDLNPGLENGQLYEIEVAWHDGSGSEPSDAHVVTLFEADSSLSRTKVVTSKTVVDGTYSDNRGVGFVCFSGTLSGGGAHFDDLRSRGLAE